MFSAHRCRFSGDSAKKLYLVDEAFTKIDPGQSNQATHKRAAIFHYVTKSRQVPACCLGWGTWGKQTVLPVCARVCVRARVWGGGERRRAGACCERGGLGAGPG